jgi:hypothetical protein
VPTVTKPMVTVGSPPGTSGDEGKPYLRLGTSGGVGRFLIPASLTRCTWSRHMQSLPTDDDGLGKEHAPATLELVNERLEEAIEQVRLANEALEVTRHEFGTLNSQLELMHEEMDRLSQEVVRLRDGYAHALNHLPTRSYWRIKRARSRLGILLHKSSSTWHSMPGWVSICLNFQCKLLWGGHCAGIIGQWWTVVRHRC